MSPGTARGDPSTGSGEPRAGDADRPSTGSGRAGVRVFAAALLVVGCAPAASLRPTPPAELPGRTLPIPLSADAGHDEPGVVGVVHVVRRGETVWRIARAYGIDAKDLMETNGITDPRTVAAGAELFVPGATEGVAVPPADGAGASGTANASANASGSASAAANAIRNAIASATSSATSASTSTGTPTPTPTALKVASATRLPDDPDARRDPPRDAARLAWPLRGVLYGRFGMRAGQRHDGIDIAAPEGAIVGAAADGAVLFAGAQAGYGEIVILRHDDGLVTLYAHASAVLVKEGARVRRGQPVARVGQTGRTTGPHLHFEVRDGTRPRNPLLFLP